MVVTCGITWANIVHSLKGALCEEISIIQSPAGQKQRPQKHPEKPTGPPALFFHFLSPSLPLIGLHLLCLTPYPPQLSDKWSLGMKCRGLTVALLNGFLKKYKSLNLGKLRCLAIVIESEEAYQTLQVIELLQWLGAIGVKSVCLYDKEGVTKKSKQAILGKLNNAVIFEVLSSICCPKESSENDKLVDHNHMMLEFASFSDGKEAVTKAANLLFMKYLKLNKLAGDQEGQIFTEPHMAEALKAIGCKGADPDLLLVYGPARCHLGFPIWRIRYTEIVHMGPLKSMRYGSLIKAIYKFTMVRQNYGK
nr:dehydrodolichyl diphosphate synthase complex subunit NUS1 isoform X2 [Ziziphus jujuba var. spinosa]